MKSAGKRKVKHPSTHIKEGGTGTTQNNEPRTGTWANKLLTFITKGITVASSDRKRVQWRRLAKSKWILTCTTRRIIYIKAGQI